MFNETSIFIQEMNLRCSIGFRLSFENNNYNILLFQYLVENPPLLRNLFRRSGGLI